MTCSFSSRITLPRRSQHQIPARALRNRHPFIRLARAPRTIRPSVLGHSRVMNVGPTIQNA